MPTSENPFDTTVWDPNNPELTYEDPMHGSEAVMGLLSIPPYKNEDGTFHVFGGLYTSGTCSFDANGKPFVEVKMGPDPSFMRGLEAHTKWIEAHHAGELPTIEDMGYPTFDLDAAPYFKFGS